MIRVECLECLGAFYLFLTNTGKVLGSFYILGKRKRMFYVCGFFFLQLLSLSVVESVCVCVCVIGFSYLDSRFLRAFIQRGCWEHPLHKFYLRAKKIKVLLINHLANWKLGTIQHHGAVLLRGPGGRKEHNCLF